jgi:hypothetical protein
MKAAKRDTSTASPAAAPKMNAKCMLISSMCRLTGCSGSPRCECDAARVMSHGASAWRVAAISAMGVVSHAELELAWGWRG